MAYLAQVSAINDATLFLASYGGGVFRDIGQVSEAKLTVSEERKELKNYQGGGGLADVVSRIDKVTLNMTVKSLSPENIAMAVFGSVDAVAAAAVSGETVTAYAGGAILLAGMATSQATTTITVTPPAWEDTKAYVLGDIVKPSAGTHFYKCKTAGSSGATEPTWSEDGTDTVDGTVTWSDMGTMVLSSGEYSLRNGVPFVPVGSTKIAAIGTPVTVAYARPAGAIVQAAINTGGEFALLVAGINRARGKKTRCRCHRLKFSPVKDLGLIGDDFAGLQLEAEVLRDDTITEEGASQFFSWEGE